MVRAPRRWSTPLRVPASGGVGLVDVLAVDVGCRPRMMQALKGARASSLMRLAPQQTPASIWAAADGSNTSRYPAGLSAGPLRYCGPQRKRPDHVEPAGYRVLNRVGEPLLRLPSANSLARGLLVVDCWAT